MNGGRYSANSGKDKYRSGYCIIKKTDEMDQISGEEGVVHGRIVHFLLKCHPSEIAAAGGAPWQVFHLIRKADVQLLVLQRPSKNLGCQICLYARWIGSKF